MVEFTVRVDDHPAVRYIHEGAPKLSSRGLFGLESTLRPKDGKLIWTLDVKIGGVQISVYLTMISLITTLFAFWFFNAPMWIFGLPAWLFLWNVGHSALYWRCLFWWALFRKGYRGEYRVLHSEGQI